MFDVGLVWERCPDGVGIHDYGEGSRPEMTAVERVAQALMDKETGTKRGLYYTPKSERRSPVTRQGIDLENPLVLQFVNASNVEAITAFLGGNGMLANREQARFEVEELRQAFAGIVDELSTMPDGERAERINLLLEYVRLRAEFDYSGPNQSGRTVFYAEALGQYMGVELATAAMRGVGAVRCANCGNAFFTGPAAHRRSDAKTCSERCRSALRRRNSIVSA